MKTDNFDKIGKEDNILDRVEQAERRARSTTRKHVKSARLSNLANEMGELDFRAVDANGNLRVVMSAYDLFDELGVHAHLAGLNTSGGVEFYLSADDGKVYTGGGAITLGELGVVFENTAGVLNFKNIAGLVRMRIYAFTDDNLWILNDTAGKKIKLSATTTNLNTVQLSWNEDPGNANVGQLDVGIGADGSKISIGGQVVLWAGKDGTETVFNDGSYDIDHRFEGATDANLFKLDGGLDAGAFGGVPESGYKLKTHGKFYATEGIKVKTNATDVLAGAVLASVFTITGAAGTFQDTGLTITLPSAGTYMVTANIRGNLRGNGGAGTTAWWLEAELYNATDLAIVTNSERLIVLTGTNAVTFQMTCTITWPITVTAAKTINLYVARNGNGTPAWTTSAIESNASGRTTMTFQLVTL